MERFKRLPEPLQKHVAARLIFGCVLLALGFICRIFLQNWFLCLPGFAAGGFLVFSGSKRFLRLASGDYLCLRGVCLEIEKAKLGRQIRRMMIDIEGKRVQLTVGKNQKHLAAGDTVTLYLLPDIPIYELDGVCRVYNWLALEHTPLGEKD